MALTSTVYIFDIVLSDVDRGVFEELHLTLARHPSESMPYLLTRLIAYCLEYREGISFTKGLANADDPAVWAHDPTGQLLLWVEVGAPSAERLHRARKKCQRVVVYTHKDPRVVIEQLKGQEIYHAEEIEVFSIPAEFLEKLEEKIQKRNQLSLSISEGELYLEIEASPITAALTKHSLL